MQAANSLSAPYPLEASRLDPSKLDPSSHVPLYLQLRDRLREAIATGSLRSGDRLTPTRNLAQELGVHRATVEAAYAELESEGLVAGHVGRGTFVAQQRSPVQRPPRSNQPRPAIAADGGSFPWSGFFQEIPGEDPLEALMRAAAEPATISFAAAHPPSGVLPMAEFRRACQRVLSDAGRAALRPGPAGGFPPLQELLSRRLAKQGIAAKPEEITIVNGCQQGLDLLAKAFVAPGQSVIAENPVYPGALLPFRQAGARILALPMTPEGPDLEALESILEAQRVRLILLTPNFQNPTGATMPAPARQRVLELSRRYQTPLVENDSYGLLTFAAKVPPSLKSLDHQGAVIYLGSLSKAGFPGLRLGWCVAPAAVTKRLRRAKQASDLHTDQFVQAVIVEFARRGALDRAVTAVRSACRANAVVLAAEVARHFPSEVLWQPPQGGMSAWFRLPAGIAADAVLARARESRVVFTPGRHFYFQDPQPETFRLSFGSVTRAEIARGVKVIGEAIRAELRAHQKESASRGHRTASAGWALV